jgi:predicted DNA-binding ribbon-helix-helix protein
MEERKRLENKYFDKLKEIGEYLQWIKKKH